MNNIVTSNFKIEDMIYEVRGKQVMLDSDLAKLYCVETKRINEAVKNNFDKFPDRFCFRIDEFEYNSLKSKFSTSNGKRRIKKRPFCIYITRRRSYNIKK